MPSAKTSLAFALFFLLASVLQWRTGACVAEFGGHPDEPSHFITGLMVRDYVASLASSPPMEYAENYYLHYPRVALGHWPPVFYVVQGGWTLLFGPSRVSLMILMALLAALLAVTVHKLIEAEYSYGAGLAAGSLLVSLPLMQSLTHAVMAELVVALLCLWAAFCWGRYLDSGHWRYSAGFGLLAALAILTKGTGLALAWIPLLATLAARKLTLVRRPSFWAPAVIVIALCAPWYLLVPAAMHQSADNSLPTLGWAEPMSPLYGLGFVLLIQLTILIIPMLAGWGVKVIGPMRRGAGASGKWAGLAALSVSLTLTSLWIGPARDHRHMSLVMPALVMFTVAGSAWLFGRRPLRNLSSSAKTALAVSLTVAMCVFNAFRSDPQPARGFSALAADIMSQPRFDDAVMLVSSGGAGEGMLICEVARRDRRPGRIVLRSSKVLAKSSWNGRTYELHYKNPDEAGEFLRQVPVNLLILDRTRSNPEAHHRILDELVRRRPDEWELIGEYPAEPLPGAEGRVAVYRQRGAENRPRSEIRIDLTDRIGKVLSR